MSSDFLISIPEGCNQFILEKGYIAVDGMSLTVGKCNEDGFFLHIIPETLRITSIGSKSVGDLVNIEIDSRTQALVEAMMKMGEAAYQGEQDMAGAQADDTNTNQDNDDVVDAEFEEVDDDKDAKKA